MYHKHLEEGSKRYKEHPNVAARYTGLPEDKAMRPEPQVFPPSPTHLPKIRDFAYEQQPDDQHHDEDDDPALSTATFLAAFTDSGFRSRYRRVNNGDLLCQAGIPDFEKITNPPSFPFQDAPVDHHHHHHHHHHQQLKKEPRRPEDHAQAQAQEVNPLTSSSSPEEETSRVDSASPDTTAGVDDALIPLTANKEKEKEKKKKKKKKKKRKSNSDIKDNQQYNRRNNWGFRDRRIMYAVAACMMEYMN